MANLFNYFFGSLPSYFKQYDTYKDGEGRGLLERYLEVYQLEAESITEEVKKLKEATNPLLVKSGMLDYISDGLGLPPVLSLVDEETYRSLLYRILRIYKYKGTIIGLRRYFSIWGLALSLSFLENDILYYDDGHLYDSNQFYDSICNKCINGTLTITPKTPQGGDLLQEDGIVDRIKKAFKVLSPIYLREINVEFDYNFLTNSDGDIITSPLGNIVIF